MLKKYFRDWLARRLQVPRIDFALERLRASGFSPSKIFDVGAYEGDFAQTCLHIWPTSQLVCFEVQPEPLKRLRLNTNPNRVKVFECLLGAETRPSVSLYMAETASSVLIENAAPQAQSAEFAMRTIDEVIANDLGGETPALLKLDVQGYELEILKGAKQTLLKSEAVLAEVNLLDIHKNAPLLHELVTWFAERRWVAFDICGLTRRPLDHALWQADLIFIPIDSPLRSDKRWT
jgi:FkbM family methyltransferase